jgi:hypothetical protein
MTNVERTAVEQALKNTAEQLKQGMKNSGWKNPIIITVGEPREEEREVYEAFNIKYYAIPADWVTDENKNCLFVMPREILEMGLINYELD